MLILMLDFKCGYAKKEQAIIVLLQSLNEN